MPAAWKEAGAKCACICEAFAKRNARGLIYASGMKLQPYVSVDGLPFSASREQIVKAHGKPLRIARNGVGLNELDYGKVAFRFQDSGRLEEVTRQAPVVVMGKIHVPFAALAAYVRDQDDDMFERAGFIVSPKFGLAFDPACPTWVTALAAHCIAAWRAI